MSSGHVDPPAAPGPAWQIELTGSEVARIDQLGGDLLIVLAAARVHGDRRQLDPALSGGHLQGVQWRLLGASWTGEPSAIIGRIDEADWRHAPSQGAPVGVALRVPSSGDDRTCLTLTSALGDTLVVQARAWRIEWMPGGRFVPSRAC